MHLECLISLSEIEAPPSQHHSFRALCIHTWPTNLNVNKIKIIFWIYSLKYKLLNTISSVNRCWLHIMMCFFLLKVRHHAIAQQLHPGQNVWHHVSGNWTVAGQSKETHGNQMELICLMQLSFTTAKHLKQSNMKISEGFKVTSVKHIKSYNVNVPTHIICRVSQKTRKAE